MKTCNICNVELQLGINCKPSSFKHGTYLCRECLSARNKENRLQNIDASRKSARDRMALWRKNNPEKALAVGLREYNITPSEYEALLNKQHGVCKLCSSPPGVNPRQKRLCVDHDHKTNIVRGLLCDKCNRALGMLGDSIESIQNVLLYVSGRL